MLPDDIEAIIATLAAVADQEGDRLKAEVLGASDATLEKIAYDNWNGGTYTYALRLRIPPQLFAEIRPIHENAEQAILDQLAMMTRGYANEHLGEVTILPSLAGIVRPGALREPDFWRTGYLRLFISHISEQAREAGLLAEHLESYGVSSFVAHRDITPTREWEDEIRLALNTMDALLAILTPGFKESNWTDQEVGVAVGRGVPVIPVRAGVDPHGFISRYQAAPDHALAPDRLGLAIFRILTQHPQTRLRMTSAIVESFINAESFAEARSRVQNLEHIDSLSQELADRLAASIDENDQIREAYGVPEKVRQIIARGVSVREPG